MTDISSDIDSVRRIAQAAGWRRIGIDGVDGTAKAELADHLSGAFECPTLDVDDYVYQNQGGYVDFVDYPALSAALSSMPAFILSGACLMEVLSNLGATLDGNIYIKRIRNDIWVDEDACVFPDGVDAAIEHRARYVAMVSSHFDERSQQVNDYSEDGSLHPAEEVMRYHDQYFPQESVDLVFERNEDGGQGVA